MKINTTIQLVVSFLFLSAICISPPLLFAQGTAFTYQGRLTSSNAPVNGSYDLTFELYDASNGGIQVGATDTKSGVDISNGLFTVVLDFGDVFDGTSFWLQIGARTNGGGGYDALSPRQELTPTPYAIASENVLGLVPASQLSGTLGIGLFPIPLNLAGSTAAPLLDSDQGGTGPAILGSRTSNSGTAAGVQGTTASTTGSANAVYGLVSSTSPGSYSAGVRGENNGNGDNGIGVYGSQAGFGWGVYGTAPDGRGVYGLSDSGVGVMGESTSGDGVDGSSESAIGVSGEHSGTSGTAAGVQGTTASTAANAYAIYGIVTSTSAGLYSAAVRGENSGNGFNGIGVYGSQAGGGWGGYFTSVSGAGVVADGGSGIGVSGVHSGTSGTAAGVQGTTASTAGSADGVYGLVSSTSPGALSAGVRGENNGTGSTGIGVYGSQAGSGWGVYGTTPDGRGVYGHSSTGTGVYASSSSGSALTIGTGAIRVSGASTNSNTAAFIQYATSGNTTSHVTTIHNSLCDGDPNAILIVTHNYNPPGIPSMYETHPFSVYYTGSNWAIYHDDLADILGYAFNVLIIKN